MGVRVWIAFALGALVLAPVEVCADPDPLAKPADAKAADHLAQGNRHYRVREFDKAIEEFKAGALIEDAPVFLYNLGQSYRQLGRYEDAIWHYERFVSRTKPTGKLKEAIDGFLAEMRAELAKSPAPPPAEGAPPAPTGGEATAPPPAVVRPVPTDERSERPGMSTRRKIAIGVAAGGLVA